MNATELFLKEGKSAGVFYCEKCRFIHRTSAEADQCCQPYKCDKCGKEIERYRTRCNACRNAADEEVERVRFEKAEKLTAWDGWVFSEGIGRDGYSHSLSDFYDNWADEHDEGGVPPKYVWACKATHFVRADVSDITERMADDAYEDWEPDTLNGLVELKAALDKFNEVNADVCSYRPDYTKAILLDGMKGAAQ